MANTSEFFSTYLPQKIASNPSLAKDINAVYQFDVDGAGTWTVDLTGDGSVAAGPAAAPGCKVTAAQADFETMLDNPASAMMLFMQGKLKVTDVNLGLKLQKILA